MEKKKYVSLKNGLKELREKIERFERYLGTLDKDLPVRKINTNIPMCPMCNTRNVRARDKTKDFFCRTCGNKFKWIKDV